MVTNPKFRLGGNWLDVVRRRKRRDGVVAIAFFLMPGAAALLLANRHHHLDVGTVTVLVSVSLGLPVLWLTWATYRDAGSSAPQASELTMAQLANQLAVAVGTQWKTEAAVRRLNDPYPLPVSWTAADPTLTDGWDSVLELASSGAGWGSVSWRDTWADGPDGLVGVSGDLVKVLAGVPTGRLVVLGGPGTGKTMLMVRLVLDLLADRADGDPVPILVSAASWNPGEEDLREWLGTQLIIAHPALAAPPPAGMAQPTQAAALLASGLILPILDGLDEIPQGVRGPAISRINDGLRPGERLVVTCRSEQYRDAIRPRGGVEVTLRAAAAVQLCPLDDEAVRRYLCDDAGGPSARARWEPVIAVLGTDASAGQALRTPLMVSLARTIYNPRPGESPDDVSDPAELCNPSLSDRAAVESHLLGAFIAAAYRPSHNGARTAQRATRWLAFLARHVERNVGGSDLAWWQLQLALPPWLVGLVAGLGSWLIASFAYWLLSMLFIVILIFNISATTTFSAGGVVITLLTYLLGAIVGGLYVGVPVGIVAGVARWGMRASSPVVLRRWLGWVCGLIGGVIVAVEVDTSAGTSAGLVVGLVIGIAVSRNVVPLDLAVATSPRVLVARNRRTAVISGLVGGSIVALLVGGFVGANQSLLTGLLSAIQIAFPCGLILAFLRAGWPSYQVTRIWLAVCRRVPWSLMGFLVDAHRRGILRQAGAVYQFRHIELQHRLVTKPPKRNFATIARVFHLLTRMCDLRD